MLLRTAAIVATLAASVVVVGGGTASAARVCKNAPSTADVITTIDPRSNLRSSPRLNGAIICTTDRTLKFDIACFERGDFFNDGKTATDVWYRGWVGWGGEPPGYAWGGNVNTTQDPPNDVRAC
ncbi:MAG TPA: hypothetical protein VF821_14265 [Lentzea sp.]